MQYVSFKRPCIAAVLVGVVTSGCVMNERAVYGIDWPEKVKMETDACPVIDGDYQNSGERFASGTYERQAVSLAHLFNGGSEKWHRAENRLGRTSFNPAEDGYQTVRLRLAEASLHIEGVRADGSTKSFDLPTRQQCKNSTLLLEGDWGGSETMLLASAVGRSTLALGRAEDGSLLVRQSETGVGFVLWLPVFAGTFADWTRFQPASAAPAQLTEVTLQPEEMQPAGRSGNGIPVR
jgi:hypothetical protein